MRYDYRPIRQHNPGSMAPKKIVTKSEARRHTPADPEIVEDFTPPAELARLTHESMRQRAREVAAALGIARFGEIDGGDVRLLTAAEVCFVLAVSRTTLRVWEMREELVPIRLGGGERPDLRYFPEDVKRLIRRGLTPKMAGNKTVPGYELPYEAPPLVQEEREKQ